MITKYQLYNESIRDLMKPKSEEDIKKSLEDLNPTNKIKKGCEHNLKWLILQGIEECGDINSEQYNPLYFC